jgi:hypothetical protein
MLAAKYPCDLPEQFSLVAEPDGFMEAAKCLGYTREQAKYILGYPLEIDPAISFLTVVITDIDLLAHDQPDGQPGMYRDLIGQDHGSRIQALVLQLLESGFAVYITADHGNAPCVGVGEFQGDVLAQTRATRMMPLKDIGLHNKLLETSCFEYSGYFLDKNYHYFVCHDGLSLDSVGASIMTHGGATLDEVIVPFITVTGMA